MLVSWSFILSGIANATDNCMYINSTNTADTDGDGVGDVCDNCPNTANANQVSQSKVCLEAYDINRIGTKLLQVSLRSTSNSFAKYFINVTFLKFEIEDYSVG